MCWLVAPNSQPIPLNIITGLILPIIVVTKGIPVYIFFCHELQHFSNTRTARVAKKTMTLSRGTSNSASSGLDNSNIIPFSRSSVRRNSLVLIETFSSWNERMVANGKIFNIVCLRAWLQLCLNLGMYTRLYPFIFTAHIPKDAGR